MLIIHSFLADSVRRSSAMAAFKLSAVTTFCPAKTAAFAASWAALTTMAAEAPDRDSTMAAQSIFSATATDESVSLRRFSISAPPGGGTRNTSSNRRKSAASRESSTFVVATSKPGASYSSISVKREFTIRDASPMSLGLVRDRAMKSHSSSKSTHGRSFAVSKTDRKLLADSPK